MEKLKDSEQLTAIALEEVSLLGLGHRKFDFHFAAGDELAVLQASGSVAKRILSPDGVVTIFMDREALDAVDADRPGLTDTDPKDRFSKNLRMTIDHELGHDIMDPSFAKCFTSVDLEEAQVTHLALAMEDLRLHPERYASDKLSTVDDCIKLGSHLLRLDGDEDNGANDWYIYITFQENITDHGTRLPAFGQSQFDRSGGSYGALAARQIELKIDIPYIKENSLSIPDIILEELWRIILNPYHKPERTGNQDRVIRHFMQAMKNLGWAA